MSLHSFIENILTRNELWLKEFERYVQDTKDVDMQKLDVERREFMRKMLRDAVPDFVDEKEILQTYLHTLMAELNPHPFLSRLVCFPKKEIDDITKNKIYFINRQLPYYE
jgi:hypothetical protein